MDSVVLKQAPAPTVGERRLQAEWQLVEQLTALNRTRLDQAEWRDNEFRIRLLATPALALDSVSISTDHNLRMIFPRFYPSVPLELYLEVPALHPNIHPLTGFVCLWDRHRISNTVEHALHKTVAILGWQLLNREPRHVMQTGALDMRAEQIAQRLQAQPLTGTDYRAAYLMERQASPRRRLS